MTWIYKFMLNQMIHVMQHHVPMSILCFTAVKDLWKSSHDDDYVFNLWARNSGNCFEMEKPSGFFLVFYFFPVEINIPNLANVVSNCICQPSTPVGGSSTNPTETRALSLLLCLSSSFTSSTKSWRSTARSWKSTRWFLHRLWTHSNAEMRERVAWSEHY